MIEVNNLTIFSVDKKFLIKVAKVVLKGENIREAELSIALVGPAKIKELNKKYRRKNKTTDVLVFGGINEVIICPLKVKKNAKKFKSTFKKELARVLIHGILHLLGYDHEKSKKEAEKMEKKQGYYLSKIR
jgi:probable rRNA maturation factor